MILGHLAELPPSLSFYPHYFDQGHPLCMIFLEILAYALPNFFSDPQQCLLLSLFWPSSHPLAAVYICLCAYRAGWYPGECPLGIALYHTLRPKLHLWFPHSLMNSLTKAVKGVKGRRGSTLVCHLLISYKVLRDFLLG